MKSDGVVIKQVEQFNYLGSMLTSDGRCETEIKRRIGIAKKSFKDLSNVLANRKISFDTRKWILKSYVWSVLLYGCETWNRSRNMEERGFYQSMALALWPYGPMALCYYGTMVLLSRACLSCISEYDFDSVFD